VTWRWNIRNRTRHFPQMGRSAWAAALAGVLAGIILAGGAVLWFGGWRAHDMTTPSMGTAAPVGSLVLSRPVQARAVHIGQVIVFHPPGRPDVTFAHRVISVTAQPGGTALQTRGDINPTPDVWTLHQSNLVGGSFVTIPDVGFVIQALPLLLLGAFLILLISSGLSQRTRGPFRIAGGAVLVAVLLVYLHPLEQADLLDEQISQGHGIATVVPTGVLPIRVIAHGGSTATAAPGQVAVVHLHHVDPHHVFRISTGIHLSGWWWLTLLGWSIPLLFALTQTRRPATPMAPLSAPIY
jgi:signal peptidase I